jgi:hypothetical protein
MGPRLIPAERIVFRRQSVLIALVMSAPLQHIGFHLYRGGICEQVFAVPTHQTSGILSDECGQPSLLARPVEWTLGGHADSLPTTSCR